MQPLSQGVRGQQSLNSRDRCERRLQLNLLEIQSGNSRGIDIFDFSDRVLCEFGNHWLCNIEHGTVKLDIGTKVRECLIRTVVIDQFSQLSDGRIGECLFVWVIRSVKVTFETLSRVRISFSNAS